MAIREKPEARTPDEIRHGQYDLIERGRAPAARARSPHYRAAQQETDMRDLLKLIGNIIGFAVVWSAVWPFVLFLVWAVYPVGGLSGGKALAAGMITLVGLVALLVASEREARQRARNADGNPAPRDDA